MFKLNSMKKNSTAVFAAAIASALAMATPTLAAPVLWTFQNVAFDDGGVLTGSFVHDSSLPDSVLSLSASVSGGNVIDLAPTTYTLDNSLSFAGVDASGEPRLFVQSNVDFIPASGIFGTRRRQLRVFFAAPLTDTHETIAVDFANAFAGECYNCAPRRRFVAGGVVVGSAVPGVPEPATWAMMLAGFSLAGAALRRKKHKAVLA